MILELALYASMGPRRCGRGKPMKVCDCCKRPNPLQWGRDAVVAESSWIDVLGGAWNVLQWGRDAVVAESRGE